MDVAESPKKSWIDRTTEKDWWDRNWKWFLPVGCLGALIVMAGFLGGIAAFVFGIIKHSDVYKESLAQAQANPAVTQILGQPIKEGFFIYGSIHVSGPSGEADVAIPISGPKGSGTIYAVATKRAGIWHFTILEVAVEGSQDRIDLRGKR